MAQLGVTRVKVDAREMRCAKEKSFLFFFFLERERGRFTFRLKSFRERDRMVPFPSIVSLFLLIVEKRRA